MRHKYRDQSFQIPSLPFLSIMLGLMSVMALTTIGISVEERIEQKKISTVELVGIPANFIPFHMRCTKTILSWLDEHNTWQDISLFELVTLINSKSKTILSTSKSQAFLAFIKKKTIENRKLSYSRQQNTLILWIEPDGVDTATIVQYIVNNHKLPLRIGSLPILEGEDIFHEAEPVD